MLQQDLLMRQSKTNLKSDKALSHCPQFLRFMLTSRSNVGGLKSSYSAQGRHSAPLNCVHVCIFKLLCLGSGQKACSLPAQSMQVLGESFITTRHWHAEGQLVHFSDTTIYTWKDCQPVIKGEEAALPGACAKLPQIFCNAAFKAVQVMEPLLSEIG